MNKDTPINLSIVILTRNRKKEIIRVLQSCVDCALPPDTEFTIIDNASEDGTQTEVERFFQTHRFEYQYGYLPENVGVAAGRNEGFRRAKGRYLYFIDDDAYIDGPKPAFFMRMIRFLEENRDVFCLSTSIYDTGLKCSRYITRARTNHISYQKMLFFLGGSFLIDRQRIFNPEILFPVYEFFGMEELYPSLQNYFQQRYVASMNDLLVIHDPDDSTRYFNREKLMLGDIHTAHVKLIFYPLIVHPVVYLMFGLRILKHLDFKAFGEAYKQLFRKNKNIHQERIPLRKFLGLVREFGFRAAF